MNQEIEAENRGIEIEKERTMNVLSEQNLQKIIYSWEVRKAQSLNFKTPHEWELELARDIRETIKETK